MTNTKSEDILFDVPNKNYDTNPVADESIRILFCVICKAYRAKQYHRLRYYYTWVCLSCRDTITTRNE